ncbi:MAG TPA: alpha/beta hydrolase [Kofleriaceae bacterium]|jgi:pimeloyl-ACP methyl ester carboxylesterase|nr:alpha/beta hydrolase [Kofleriaceae bacterium]
MVPGLEHRTLTVRDGTRIGYQVRGQGPVVVLANGLGGTYEAFRHVYAELGEDYRTICWDYRGLYRSSLPVDRSCLAMGHHCDDLEQILDAEKVDHAVFVGWSMGVQLNFEFFRKRGRRMDGIVAINGTYGRPFETAMGSRVVKNIIPVMLRAIRAQAALVGRATRSVIGWQGLVGMMQRFGMVSRTLDVDAFRDVAEGFKTMDWACYTDLIERLGQHDAEDVLPTIDVPTLIITGDRDIITPPFTAERMHRAIGGSRLVVIAGGTHYTPVEFPAVIREEIRDFLDRIPGYQRAGSPRAARG